MTAFAIRYGTEIFYKDCGSGPSVVFTHKWPCASASWGSQPLYLASRGCRGIAPGRRGHGRARQSLFENAIDTYAESTRQRWKVASGCFRETPTKVAL